MVANIITTDIVLKRTLDITLAGVGLILLLPVFAVIGVLIKLTSPGPVLYQSLRIGQHYKPFYMFKFRTMFCETDAKRDWLRQQSRLQNNLFKLKMDPRVTPLGKLLRVVSLDELPQLVNVLKGDMSLVGPRPLPPDESRMFKAPYTLRYQVLPGITGAWQVNGRSTLDFKTMCRLEFSYVNGWTLWQDMKILLQTIPAVISTEGAY